MAKIIVSRKMARTLIDVMPSDTQKPYTGIFFEMLVNALDNEQGADPDDREGIEIVVEGTEM